MAFANVHDIGCYLGLRHNPAVDLDLPARYPSVGVERVEEPIFRAKEHAAARYGWWSDDVFRREEAPGLAAIILLQRQQRIGVDLHPILFLVHTASDKEPVTLGDWRRCKALAALAFALPA